jgi:putative serine protease PepD
MNDEPSPGSGPGSGRLWTDPREAEEHTPWLEPRRNRPLSPLPPLHAPDNGRRSPDDDELRRRRRTVGILVGTLLAALLIGAGVLGANLLRGDDELQPAALPVAPGAAPADQRTRSIRAIYAAVKDSVVPVRVSGAVSAGSGTGFVIDKGGVIVTNAHVVKDAQAVSVRVEDKGDYVDADVLGVDEQSDLAVLRVAGAGSKLKPLRLADSDKVQVGDATLAVGFPLGLNRSASASSGIVSGVGRSLPAGSSPFKIERVIQTDAAINPGNSGGPLLDSAGRVIGVNTAILTAGGGGGSVGVGFAVPSNMVRKVVPRLESGRSAQHAYLGVSTREFQSGPGAYLAEVVPGGPASSSGLRIGDVIVAIDGEPITIPEDISIAIEDRKPGNTVSIEVQRAGASEVVQVTLGNRPTGVGSAPTTP